MALLVLRWLRELASIKHSIVEVGLLRCGDQALALIAEHMPHVQSLVYQPDGVAVGTILFLPIVCLEAGPSIIAMRRFSNGYTFA
jgi:hypothetical protein